MMKTNSLKFLLMLSFAGMTGCFYGCATTSKERITKSRFVNPPEKFRPQPFWHINGMMTTEGIGQRLTEAKNRSGFGGVAVLPVNAGTQWGTSNPCPGTSPEYLSEEYFHRYADILETSRKLGTEVILYDDIDFPSGSAGGRLKKEYPQYTRKYLEKEEFYTPGGHISRPVNDADSCRLIAVSAMDTVTGKVTDLQPYLKGKQLEWDAPKGNWRVMTFYCRYYGSDTGGHSNLVDYMQPEAVSKLLEMTYQEYEKRFNNYFGNVIKKTFFDDVGFVHQENTWTTAITDLFRSKYKKNPALYYPALFYNIGPETQAARVAFYDLRAELMAEGYVRQVAEWSGSRKLQSMGHPSENYSPNTVVANGDILKYYRHTQIPLLDGIFFYGRGMHGFKQISSAADLGDKPVVGAELCGAFSSTMDSLTLYRTAMDAIARGVNFVVPHGMWYTTDTDKVRIPPLISPENPRLRDCLPRYSAFVGRSCLMLQGGKRVSDIALLWPIASIEAESYINRDKNSGLPVANWVPEHVNHQQLSQLLTTSLRRDFTYVHPEDLCNGRITPNGRELRLNNKVNIQNFKVLIMPGGDVISAETLKAIETYYNQGGKVIATASLPFRSSEFGRDEEVCSLIEKMLGVDPKQGIPGEINKKNQAGGCFSFVPKATKERIESLLLRMDLIPDVDLDDSSADQSKIGYLTYLHKEKEGKEIYFFSNTTDTLVDTQVSLRGRVKIEKWNPYTGSIEKWKDTEFYKDEKGNEFTRIHLVLEPVSSVFAVSD